MQALEQRMIVIDCIPKVKADKLPKLEKVLKKVSVRPVAAVRFGCLTFCPACCPRDRLVKMLERNNACRRWRPMLLVDSLLKWWLK
jgi:hypothetical protein